MGINSDALQPAHWSAIARHLPALRAAKDQSDVAAAAKSLSEGAFAPAVLKPRALYRWFAGLGDAMRSVLSALHTEASAREELQKGVAKIDRVARTDVSMDGQNGAVADAFGVAAIAPTVRRRPLIRAINSISVSARAGEPSSSSPALAPAAPPLPTAVVSEIESAVRGAVDFVAGRGGPSKATMNATPEEAVAPTDAALKFALKLGGAKKTAAKVEPAAADPQATQVLPSASLKKRTLVRADSTSSSSDGVVVAVQPRRAQPKAASPVVPKAAPQPASHVVVDDAADSLLAKLGDTSDRQVVGAVRIADVPMSACQVCGEDGGDLSRCRFCKHLLHETCGGPRPDQPPNLQRCDACSAALGLDRLTSSDDDDDSRSDHDYDTSLDGFIASSSDDEDDDFDFNALVDRDDDDSTAQDVSSSTSSPGSPPAVTGRKHVGAKSLSEVPARISIEDSEETQPLLSAVKAPPVSRPSHALADESDSDSSAVAVVAPLYGRGRGGRGRARGGAR